MIYYTVNGPLTKEALASAKRVARNLWEVGESLISYSRDVQVTLVHPNACAITYIDDTKKEAM